MKLLSPFIQLMLSASFLFIASAILAQPLIDVVEFMNTNNVKRAYSEWVMFVIFLTVSAFVWSGAWLWFKYSEKRCMDYLASRKTLE